MITFMVMTCLTLITIVVLFMLLSTLPTKVKTDTSFDFDSNQAKWSRWSKLSNMVMAEAEQILRKVFIKRLEEEKMPIEVFAETNEKYLQRNFSFKPPKPWPPEVETLDITGLFYALSGNKKDKQPLMDPKLHEKIKAVKDKRNHICHTIDSKIPDLPGFLQEWNDTKKIMLSMWDSAKERKEAEERINQFRKDPRNHGIKKGLETMGLRLGMVNDEIESQLQQTTPDQFKALCRYLLQLQEKSKRELCDNGAPGSQTTSKDVAENEKTETNFEEVKPDQVVDFARTLIEEDSDPKGRHQLHLAAKEGNVQLMELLMSVGADVDETDAEGWTPLTYAVAHNQYSAVDVLLAGKADVAIKTKEGKTLIDIAEMHNTSFLAEFFDFDVLHHTQDGPLFSN